MYIYIDLAGKLWSVFLVVIFGTAGRVLTRFQSTGLCWFSSTNIEWDVPDFVMKSRHSSVTTDKLRFQVAGNLASTQDFYLFTEFMVFGV